ncbi:MAG: hypothetical protein H6974_05855 [Gammaproteobacteria bacterium]|nr:hypothetical protein [Gammaproteobacteria bacterium]
MRIIPTSKLELSPFAIVVFVSIFFGCLQGLVGNINFSDAIQHGQVLSGKVVYPVDHPIGLYYSRAYSLANHISGLWLKIGFSELSLAVFLQGLKGIILFVGLALCTFALTERVMWSVLSPMIWYAFGLFRFTDAYPVTSIIHNNTNGFLGLVGFILTLGLIANRRWLSGSFSLGILPYIHLSFGIFGWLLGIFWFIANRSKILKFYGFFWGAMVFVISFIIHRYMFFYSSSVSSILAEYYYYFYTLLFDYHRQPLQATSVHTFILLVVCFLAIFYLFLSRKLSNYRNIAIIPIVVILTVVLALFYSVIGSIAGLIVIPKIVLTLMPGRLANLALLLSGPLLFGLIFCLPSRIKTLFSIILLATSMFLPKIVTDFGLASYGLNEPVSVFVWFLALSVSLLLANYTSPIHEPCIVRNLFRYQKWDYVYVLRVSVALLLVLLAFSVICVFTPTVWYPIPLSLEDPRIIFGFICLVAIFFILTAIPALRYETINEIRPYSAVVSLVGSLVVGILVFSINVGWLFSEKKILFLKLPEQKLHINSNLIPGQVIPTISDSMIQLDSGQPALWFSDARTILPYVPEAGAALERVLEDVYGWYQLYDPGTWGISLKNIWEGFSTVDWQRITTSYAVRTIVAPCDFQLTIPLAYRSENNCFYNLPNVATWPPKEIPAFKTLDNGVTRYFFFPRTAWVSQGWHPLEVDSTLTSTWAWLEKSGKIGIYVSQDGDYHLSATVVPIGSQQVSIGLHGTSVATPFYLLPPRECHGDSDFRFDALHLSAGFNIIDVRAKGQPGDIGSGGRKASILFKNIRLETVEEVNAAQNELDIGHCLTVVLPNDKEISSKLILGDWYYQGKLANISIADSAGSLICTNESGVSTKSIIKNSKLLWAMDWNIYATISRDGKELKWSNGSVWTR